MIRSLVLELKSDYRVYTRNTNVSYTRDNIWRDWSISLFNDDRDSIYGWGSNNLSFPQLEKLTLDFTEWQLTENDGVLVLLLESSWLCVVLILDRSNRSSKSSDQVTVCTSWS